MNCESKSSYPIYSWYKNGNVITNQSSTFIIKYAQRTDGGNYSCSVHNKLGNKTSITKEFNVKCKGKFKSIRLTSFHLSEDLTLCVSAILQKCVFFSMKHQILDSATARSINPILKTRPLIGREFPALSYISNCNMQTILNI